MGTDDQALNLIRSAYILLPVTLRAYSTYDERACCSPVIIRQLQSFHQ